MLDSTLTWLSSNVPVVAAIVTASVSALVALVALLANPFISGGLERLKGEINTNLERVRGDTLREIELHKAQLSDGNAERSARRDYEYDAKKRLYTEIEPLMFQLREAAEAAFVRVQSLTRTSRNGNLGSEGWLSREDYYLASTVYRLLLPAVFLRILQRRMTLIDMKLDATYARRYSLLKAYAMIFSDDYGLAGAEPKIDYRPNETGVTDATHIKQGVYMGHLERALDLLIVSQGESQRPKTFGEFERAISKEGAERAEFEPLLRLFSGFGPMTHSVLARGVIALGCVARLIVETFDDVSISDRQALDRFLQSSDFAGTFPWNDNPEKAEVYRGYFAKKLIGSA